VIEIEALFGREVGGLIRGMKVKDRPNQKMYIQALRRMTPEKRLLKAFELTQFSEELFLQGLHRRFPDLSEEAITKIYLERIDKCHNRNY
jgi:hypothetical protein